MDLLNNNTGLSANTGGVPSISGTQQVPSRMATQPDTLQIGQAALAYRIRVDGHYRAFWKPFYGNTLWTHAYSNGYGAGDWNYSLFDMFSSNSGDTPRDMFGGLSSDHSWYKWRQWRCTRLEPNKSFSWADC